MKLTKISYLGEFLLLSFAFSAVSSQFNPTATQVAEFLQSPVFPQIYYDGDEWVYIFNRIMGTDTDYKEFWRLSTTNLSLEKIDSSPVNFYSYGYGASIGSKVYLFGPSEVTNSPDSSILEFTAPANFSNVQNLNGIFPYSKDACADILPSEEIFIVCGQYCDNTYMFNPNENSIGQISRIPVDHHRSYPTTTILNNKAYIFGRITNYDWENNQTYSVVDLKTMEFSHGPDEMNYIKHTGPPAAINDGESIFLIPTNYDLPNSRSDGIFKIDPESGTHQFIPVDNFPLKDNQYFTTAPTAVYVEKLNGFFMVGGEIQIYSGGNAFLHGIWFVDLNPLSMTTEPTTSTTPAPTTTTLNPDLFSCANHTTGFHPHPLDCARFIACHEGVAEYYECPKPLLFDPVLGTCNAPQLVDCDISCVGKDDGLYPHPHECALFITCFTEELEVFRCPSPLLFDPLQNKCNFPEDVTC